MAQSKHTQRLYEDIKKDFDRLNRVKEYGVKKYSIAYILHKLSDKYYRSPRTIENIVFGRVGYPTSQLEVPDQKEPGQRS